MEYNRMDLPDGTTHRGAYTNVGNNVVNAGMWNKSGQDPKLYAAYNWGVNAPGEFRLPTFNFKMPTPMGNYSVGTNDGNPNIFTTYQPNAQAQTMARALLSLLGR